MEGTTNSKGDDKDGKKKETCLSAEDKSLEIPLHLAIQGAATIFRQRLGELLSEFVLHPLLFPI